MKRCTDLLTLYFPQPCLEKNGPFAEIRQVRSYKDQRLSLSKGNINLTDYWYTMLDVFLNQEMSYTCQHIGFLSDEDPDWWRTQCGKGKKWICLSFIKLNLENGECGKAEDKLKKLIGGNKCFRTFGNADFIFAFFNQSEEELLSNLDLIRKMNEPGPNDGGKSIFFSNYHLYGECKLTDEGVLRIPTYHINDGGGCQRHKLYHDGWCIEEIDSLRTHIKQSQDKKNKKMVAYYQGLGQILNIVAQYEQPDIFKDLFYMFYPPISLFMKQLERAEKEIDVCREIAKNEPLDSPSRIEAKYEKYTKMKKFELSISEFIDSMEVLLHHMGHSCRDILSDAGRGGIPYDIPIRLSLMYTAYLHVLTGVLNDEPYEYEFCFAPLAYSRPVTKCLDFGLQPRDRLIRVQIAKHTLFMPRTLLIILAHEASHYVSNYSRARKLRAKCFVKIANLAVVQCLVPPDILHEMDIRENHELETYLEELRYKIYDYLTDNVWTNWADKDENDSAFYFAEFYENLKMNYRLLLEGADQLLDWTLEYVDMGTVEALKTKDRPENLFRDILKIQEYLKSQKMVLWNKNILMVFLDSIANNMKEVYADISAILLLDLSPDDFLESYIISESYVPDEDVMTSELINRIAMVKYVMQGERAEWKNWRTASPAECGSSETKQQSEPNVEGFLNKLKERTDNYIKIYEDRKKPNLGEEKQAPASDDLSDSNEDLFQYVQVFETEFFYFEECFQRMKSYLAEADEKEKEEIKNKELNDKKIHDKEIHNEETDSKNKVKTHQQLLKLFFGHFQNCDEGEETSYEEFFKDYEDLIKRYKDEVIEVYKNRKTNVSSEFP